MWHRALSGLLDLVAPPTCAACGSPVNGRAAGFCEACRPLIEPAPPQRGALADRDACLYGGPLRDALHRLKYEGASEVAPVLAALLREQAQAFAGQVEWLTVVPLHPRRLRERGYHQGVLLARPIARLLALPLEARLLSRVRETPAQVGKRRTERATQLAQAFRARPEAQGRAILVIDDVRTTGATLAEARRALQQAGARAVYTLALARSSPE